MQTTFSGQSLWLLSLLWHLQGKTYSRLLLRVSVVDTFTHSHSHPTTGSYTSLLRVQPAIQTLLHLQKTKYAYMSRIYSCLPHLVSTPPSATRWCNDNSLWYFHPFVPFFVIVEALFSLLLSNIYWTSSLLVQVSVVQENKLSTVVSNCGTIRCWIASVYYLHLTTSRRTVSMVVFYWRRNRAAHWASSRCTIPLTVECEKVYV